MYSSFFFFYIYGLDAQEWNCKKWSVYNFKSSYQIYCTIYYNNSDIYQQFMRYSFPYISGRRFFLHICQFGRCEVISHCEFAFSLLGARVSIMNMYLGDWINWPKKFHILCPFSYWFNSAAISILTHVFLYTEFSRVIGVKLWE